MANREATRSGLVEPYPSSPKRPPNYHLCCRKDGRLFTIAFFGTYAAKHALNALLEGRTFKWKNDDEIICDDGMSIKDSRLEELIEYDMKGAEKDWVLDDTTGNSIKRFIAGGSFARESKEEQVATGEKTKATKTKPEKKEREKKERIPRASKEGLVTVGDIAERLKMDAREARGILRTLKVEKPDAGWAWPDKEADAIAERIEKARKA